MSIMSAATTEALSASWLAPCVEIYVAWLREQRVRDTVVRRRVPLLLKFGAFARAQAATRIDQLPPLIGPFVEDRVRRRGRPCPSPERLREYAGEVRVPIEQMLRVALPGPHDDHQPTQPTFFGQGLGFFDALQDERGLRDATVSLYRHHLTRFEQFLDGEGISDLDAVLPVDLDRFLVSVRSRLCPAAMPAVCSSLRLLFQWLYRERRISRDIGGCIEAPQVYRLSTIPRSIPWDDVERTLAAVDRTVEVGRRDYAMLTLIVLYGLRAREVAALTLDDLDWKGERLSVGGRKAGHSTTYPLSGVAGDALIAYLRDGRPVTTERRIFLQAVAPRGPVTHHVVSARVGRYLRKAGIVVSRPGSHTLRHSCAQRLVDADFSLKVIGDYLGHRGPSSTEIYTKVAVETLRQVALGDGEVVL